MSHNIWGDKEDSIRIEYLLHEVLTKTTSVQPIIVSYSKPIFMLHPWGIDHNREDDGYEESGRRIGDLEWGWRSSEIRIRGKKVGFRKIL